MRELLARVDSNELSEWLAFDAEYTLPDPYLVTGQVCAVTAAAVGGAKNVSPADFVPYFKPPQQHQSPSEIKAFMAALRTPRV